MSTTPQSEQRRVRRHLTRALRAVDAHPPAGLSATQRARRGEALAALRRYIDAGRYPVNRVSPRMTPVFIDGDGARCAVAALLESSGHAGLAARVAREHNLARVRELADDDAFVAWLDAHGLTLAEAARIQPAYHAYTDAHYQPTASVVASVVAGASTDRGALFGLAPGVRLGVRRVIRGSTDNGSSVHGSLALVVEYARTFVVGVGSTNHLGLLLQWEPEHNSNDYQWYLLGGPVASLDEDDAPGNGYGGQFGGGFSFRHRPVPLFAEGVVQGLGYAGGSSWRLSANLGVVW